MPDAPSAHNNLCALLLWDPITANQRISQAKVFTHTHTRTQMRNGEIELIELNASNDCVCSFFRLFLCDIFRWPAVDTMPISTKLGFLGASVIRTFVKLIEPSIDNCNLIQSMSLYPISDGVVCLSWKYFVWINTNRTGFRLLSYQNRLPTTFFDWFDWSYEK